MEDLKAKDLTASVTINLARKITSGGHSDVYRGRLAVGGDGNSKYVAVKIPRYAPTHISPKITTEVKNEIDLWSKLEHPNILPLLGIYRLEEADILPGTVSPWCDNGTLIEYMRSARDGLTKRTNDSEPMKDGSLALLCLEVELLSQATSGLEYLHAQNIIHGDLKGCNILVQDGIARLGDFGYSVLVAERLGSTSSHLGTPRWFSPESLESGARRTPEADIWALGCVVLEVCTLQVPYHGRTDQAVHTALHGGYWPYTYPHNMNVELWRIAGQCWSRSPSRRPTSQLISSDLQNILFPLRTLADMFVSSSGLPLSKFTAASALSAIARMSEDADTNSKTELNRVRDVIDGLAYLGERYRPTLVRSSARSIAMRDPALADRLMTKLSMPELRTPLRGDISVDSVAFLADGRRLACSSSDLALCIWDIKTSERTIVPLEGHTLLMGGSTVHASRIACGSEDGTFRIWDAHSGKLVLGPVTAHNSGDMNCIAYSRSGTRIATAGDDKGPAIWDADTGVQLREMVGNADLVSCVAFSEDGTRLVSGSQDNKIRIWDVSSGECVGEPMKGHGDFVTAVCFSLDNKHIFSSSDDGTIRIWDAETRALTGEPLRMDGAILCMALSPDGKRLVSGSRSGKIAMWDAETGTPIPTPFQDHKNGVRSVAFSPDGRVLASASEDKTIALWDATDDWKRWNIFDEEVEKDNS